LEEEQQNLEETRIAWHPAFYEAIQMELEPYKDALQFDYEYQLSSEPLRIDVIVIKKTKDIKIEKNIAAIFRGHNILEYKSPADYVSVKDFYKACSYVCLYIAINNEVSITDITLSFVESRYPRELLAHLKEVLGYTVEERSPGIYTVMGSIIPIQVIDSRELAEEENIWLKGLDNELDTQRIARITTEIALLGKAAQIRAYLEAIFKANPERLKEALRMSETTLTLEKVFEEVGFIAKWEARGEAKGEARGEAKGEARGEAKGEAKSKRIIAQRMLAKGWTLEEVAEIVELDAEILQTLSPQA
jgi:hypothetical protein